MKRKKYEIINEQSCKKFFKDHYRHMMNYAKTFDLTVEDAENIVQEVFGK